MCRGRDENVFRLDIAMEEVMSMDMLQALHDLEQNALDAAIIEALVLASLHELVQIAVHILHADMELLAERIKKDI
jgi:hypothetical protein